MFGWFASLARRLRVPVLGVGDSLTETGHLAGGESESKYNTRANSQGELRSAAPGPVVMRRFAPSAKSTVAPKMTRTSSSRMVSHDDFKNHGFKLICSQTLSKTLPWRWRATSSVLAILTRHC